MIKNVSRNDERIKRHIRLRKKISGTPECPRLSVFRSNAHIHAQIIDDVNGVTLAAASSVSLKLANGGNKEAAEAWINFICRPDIALKNFEYITYSTPNESARALIEDEAVRNSQIAFPDNSVLSRCTVYNYLGKEGDSLYDYYWTMVGGAESD